MIIKTITCHDVNNYGASLQAFALQTFLLHQGHDVEIINYKPPYQYSYKIDTNVPEGSRYYKICKAIPMLKYVRGLKNYLLEMRTRGRVDAFKDFNKKYLRLTKQYSSIESLLLNPPVADIYIAGSDQIWSTNLPNGSDPSFYLQFGSLKTKRISYAASFAHPEIYKGFDVMIKSFLSSFDCISVREKTGVIILDKLGYKGTHVLDPVFLLSADEWYKTFELEKLGRPMPEKYILVYDLVSNTDEIRNKARQLAKVMNCKIVAICDSHPNRYAEINFKSASPIDFVNLIANSECVIADSFHASAFSVIFNKPLWIYYHKTNVSRISDMLDIMGLGNRLNSELEELPEICWQEVNERMALAIHDSKLFLINALGKRNI